MVKERKIIIEDIFTKKDSPFADVMGAGDYINKERLLAEFFDIDLDAANKERELLLKSLQEHKQGEMEMYYEQEN